MINFSFYIFRFFLLSAVLLASFSIKAAQLNVASDIWCPYICEDPNNPGYIVELVNQIYAENNVTTRFETIPLARAINLAQKNQINLVLGLTKAHLKSNSLQNFSLSVGSFSNDLYVKKGNNWRFTSPKNLIDYLKKGNKVGIIRGYVYGEFFDLLFASNPEYFHVAHGDSPLLSNLEMLNMGRISILLDTKNTILHEASPHIKPNLVYAGTEGENVPLYIGFSPNTPSEYTDMLNNGIVSFRQTKRLNQLLNKYGIEDWK